MARYESNIEKLREAIEIAGGMGNLSAKSKISYQSIMDWRSGKKSPSPISCKKIEKAVEGKVKAEELLPSYPWEDLE